VSMGQFQIEPECLAAASIIGDWDGLAFSENVLAILSG
jgi:hypothetical protein